MPHCILEYSNNISEEPNHSSILRQIHNALFSTGLFDLNDIKKCKPPAKYVLNILLRKISFAGNSNS
jgi:hypothetical protein